MSDQHPGCPYQPAGDAPEERSAAPAQNAEMDFRLVVESAPHAILMTARSGTIVLVNRKAEEMFGYERGELLGRSVDMLVPPRWRAGHAAQRAGFSAEPKTREMGVGRDLYGVRKDGSEVPVEIGLNPLTMKDGEFVLAAIIDITERKRSEAALRDSERRFEELFKKMAHGAAVWAVVPGAGDFVLVDINPAGLRQLGREEPETVVGKRVGEAFPGAMEPGLLPALSRVERTGETESFAAVYHAAPGLSAYLEYTVYKLPCGRVASIFADVSERRRAEEALRSERDRLSLVTGNVGVGLAVISSDLRTVWANEVMGTLFGDTVGKPCHDFFRRRAQDSGVCGIETIFETGAQRVDYEQMGLTVDGKPMWARIIASPLRDDKGAVTSVLGAVVPVTERRILEEQLRQSQKMEAIGRLAGGMAHDFNNSLTAIMGFAELLVEDLSDVDRSRERARQIVVAAEKAAELTRRLLAFSRRQLLLPRIVDLNETVAGVSKFLRPMIREDIQLAARLEPEAVLVKVDPLQFEQAIINLALNARDAMPTGGTLTIATRGVVFDEALVLAHPDLKLGPGVLLEVRDTGEGMDEKTLASIFEPFFTTKPLGKGTGLGLSMVFGIVKQSGGDIVVESRPGQGATFRVYLPRAKGAAPAAPAQGQAGAAPRGSETVLLIEDDAAVRLLTGEILCSQGYTVLAAGSGAQGLLLAREHQGPLHLLVSDVVMPGLSGPEVARRLSAFRRETRILFLSGYAGDAITRHGVLDPGIAFLAKPFTRQDFLRKVRETIDSPALAAGIGPRTQALD